MTTGLVVFVTGIVTTLIGVCLCGEWADRHSIRPFVWLFSAGMGLVTVGFGIILWQAVLR